MVLSVTHSTVVVVPDDGTSPVGTDEWNAGHAYSGILDAANGGTGTATGISAATQAALDAKVAKSGDTMTGNLVIDSAGFAELHLDNASSSFTSNIRGKRAGVDHWVAQMGDGTAADDYSVLRFNDSGTLVDAPLVIVRSTGNLVFHGDTYTYRTGGTSGAQFFGYIGSSAYLYYDGTAYTLNGGNLWSGSELQGGNIRATTQGYKPGGGDWADSSDARIKAVLGPYEASLDEVLALEPVRFTYKGNDTIEAPSTRSTPTEAATREGLTAPYPNSPHYGAVGTEFVGLMAQAVEPVMPEMVRQIPGYIDGEPVQDLRILDTTALVYALVNSVKVLAARVAALEAPNG